MKASRAQAITAVRAASGAHKNEGSRWYFRSGNAAVKEVEPPAAGAGRVGCSAITVRRRAVGSILSADRILAWCLRIL